MNGCESKRIKALWEVRKARLIAQGSLSGKDLTDSFQSMVPTRR
jgi:hypothetical protein